MTDYIATDTELTSVANAIRAKGGTNAQLTFPTEFISAINDISTASYDDDVLFIDYDGTLLYSYSAEQFQALTQMPANPDRTSEGLTSQGWNFTLANAKAQVTATGKAIIGQLYMPTDEKTHVFIHIEDIISTNQKTISLCYSQSVKNGVTIDWGDNTSTYTYNYALNNISVNHTYASGGDYEITFSVSSGTLGFGNNSSSNYTLIGSNYTNADSYKAYLIRKVYIGKDVVIKGYTFYSMSLLEKVSFPSSLSYGSNLEFLFNYCYNLKAVVFPNGIQSLYATMRGCDSLQIASLPYSVETLGSDLFDNCYALKYVAIPANTTTISSTAFYACSALTNITLPNGLTNIGDQAFTYCQSLKSIVLPDTITTIDNYYTFKNCSALETVVLPNGLTNLPSGMFEECTSLKSVTLPSSLTSLPTNIFKKCYSLESINLPSTLTTISGDAFIYCSGLRKITIPSSVTSISTSFGYSYPEYHMESTTPPTLSASGIYKYTGMKIYVPRSTNQTVLNAYKSATNWSSYQTNLEEEPE